MKKKISVTTGIFLLIVLMFPFKKVLVPQWNVKVVDESNLPIADIFITNDWRNYSFPYGENEIRLKTNESGDVSFPEAYIYTTLGCEIIRFVLELNPLLKLPHIGSTGVNTSVLIPGVNSISVGPTQEKVNLPNVLIVDREAAKRMSDYFSK